MRIRVLTLFPEMLEPVFHYGVVGRAINAGRIDIGCINPRRFPVDRHGSVDDRPYGGGPGMVMRVEPLIEARQQALQEIGDRCVTVLMSPQGRRLDQQVAQELSGADSLILVCGRYEGIDQRFVDKYVDMELSLGDFVLSGGEIAAAATVDAVTRWVPGVLGHQESASQDSFAQGLLDYPHFTRPDAFEGMPVPSVLLSGDHQAIERWRKKMALGQTWQKRPDLLELATLTDEEQLLLEEFKTEIENSDCEK